MSIGFRPTEEDNEIIQAHKRAGESTADVLRRALRSLDREEWERQAREDMERIAASGEDLSTEPDDWGYDETGEAVLFQQGAAPESRPAEPTERAERPTAFGQATIEATYPAALPVLMSAHYRWTSGINALQDAARAGRALQDAARAGRMLTYMQVKWPDMQVKWPEGTMRAAMNALHEPEAVPVANRLSVQGPSADAAAGSSHVGSGTKRHSPKGHNPSATIGLSHEHPTELADVPIVVEPVDTWSPSVPPKLARLRAAARRAAKR